MAEVKLISYWACWYGLKVELALKAKGIPFEYIEQDIFEQKSDLLLESNPVYKKVPVLIHNGRPICESSLILQYIDDTWPATPRFTPEDPYNQYLVRFWSAFIEEKRLAILFKAFKALDMSAEEKSVAMKAARQEYGDMGMTLEKAIVQLDKRGLIYDGKDLTLTYMDLCFASSLTWMGALEHQFGLSWGGTDTCPSLHRWAERLVTNPLVMSTVPDGDKLKEYAKKRWG